jgi:hypothetical protein
MDPDAGSTLRFSRPCTPYIMIIDCTHSDKLCMGSACVAVYSSYGNTWCLLNINEILCLARAAGNLPRVQPAWQVTFRVFWSEKRIPGREAYVSVCCVSGATASILFSGKYGKLRKQWSTP